MASSAKGSRTPLFGKWLDTGSIAKMRMHHGKERLTRFPNSLPRIARRILTHMARLMENSRDQPQRDRPHHLATVVEDSTSPRRPLVPRLSARVSAPPPHRTQPPPPREVNCPETKCICGQALVADQPICFNYDNHPANAKFTDSAPKALARILGDPPE